MMKKILFSAILGLALAFPVAVVTAADQVVIAPDVPSETSNMAVRNIDDMIYRIVKEMARMTSARVTAIHADDALRLEAYYVRLLTTIETATASRSDWHYLAIMPLRNLDDAAALIENPAIQAAMNHLIGTDVNMRISPSGRGNDSLTPDDKKDLVQGVLKSKTYVDDFLLSGNPLDFNQSAPDRAVVTPMVIPVN